MGRKGILISSEQAKVYARRIYQDVAAYIHSHQTEYQEFLLREGREVRSGKEAPKKNRR